MAVPTEIRQRAISMLENLPGTSLIKAVEFLESLAREGLAESTSAPPETSESALLETSFYRCITTHFKYYRRSDQFATKVFTIESV